MQKRKLNTCNQVVYSFLHFRLPTNTGPDTDSTPELFGKHLREAVEMVRGKAPEHRIILLKSWNEWAEGNYVEPDLKWGRGYLEAIRREVMDE